MTSSTVITEQQVQAAESKDVETERTEEAIDIMKPTKTSRTYSILPVSFTSRISTPGLHMLSDADIGLIRKLFWVLLFSASITVTAWNISQQFVRYYRYDLDTSIRIVQESEVTFPSISFCTDKKYFRKAAEDSEGNFSSAAVYGRIFFTKQHLQFTIVSVTSSFRSCVQFNPHGNIKSTEWGKYSNALIDLKDMVPMMGVGIELLNVYIHPHAVHPASLEYTDLSLLVDANDDINVDIRFATTKTIHHTHRLIGCNPDVKYVQDNCLYSCMEQYMNNNCSCGDIELRLPFKLCYLFEGVCYWNTTVLESAPTHVWGTLINNQLVMSGCRARCPLQCETTTYTPTMFTWSGSERQRGMMSVFFESLDVKYIETRESYDVYQLICDVGGGLGLLLGASILTAMDITDYLLMLAIRVCDTRIRGCNTNRKKYVVDY